MMMSHLARDNRLLDRSEMADTLFVPAAAPLPRPQREGRFDRLKTTDFPR